MTPKWEILQLAYELTSQAIIKPNNFNPELAIYSLRIFIGVAVRKPEIEAAQTVLDELDGLGPLARADRRSRVWQDHKLRVQDAFSQLARVYDETLNLEAFKQAKR